MAFDIYGERLTPGHCEVHPWVAEEYPCFQCGVEDQARRARTHELDVQRHAALALGRIENSDEQSDPGVI
jgi:hypothetical protein